MKTRHHQTQNHALTRLELLVVILLLVVLTVILLPSLIAHRSHAMRVSCANNVKQILLSYRLWAQDHRDLFPMQVSVANGGAMELAATGNVVAVYLVISNELSTPRVLRCAYDEHHPYASDFISLAATNISYFVGLDAGTNHSGTRLLAGDANLALRGKALKSGLIYLASNAPVKWDASRVDRHSDYGYLGLADGSVEELKLFEFSNSLFNTGLATNRLVIP